MDSIGTAFYIWTYPYVVYSNTDWLLHIDSNSKANMCEKDVLQYYLILWTVFKFLLPCLTDMFHLDTIQARIDSLGLDILVGNFGYFY